MTIDYNYPIDIARIFLFRRNRVMKSMHPKEDDTFYHSLAQSQLAACCNLLGLEFWDLCVVVKSIMRYEHKHNMLRPLRFDAKKVVESVTYR